MGWFRRDKATIYADALTKIAVNIWEIATVEARPDHAPLVFRFERPDSSLRYLFFCLGTAYYFSRSKDDLATLDAGVKKAWENLVTGLASEQDREVVAGFVTGPFDRLNGPKECADEIAMAVEGWKSYIDQVASSRFYALEHNTPEAPSTALVCTMLRHVESSDGLDEEDLLRLWPLATWLEQTIPVIGSSFRKLTA